MELLQGSLFRNHKGRSVGLFPEGVAMITPIECTSMIMHDKSRRLSRKPLLTADVAPLICPFHC